MNAGEYMIAFKNNYEKIRYLNNISLIDPSVLRKIVETIKQFIHKNIYKGKAGEGFRLTTCRLLECMAMINIPLEDSEVELFNVSFSLFRHSSKTTSKTH